MNEIAYKKEWISLQDKTPEGNLSSEDRSRATCSQKKQFFTPNEQKMVFAPHTSLIPEDLNKWDMHGGNEQ